MIIGVEFGQLLGAVGLAAAFGILYAGFTHWMRKEGHQMVSSARSSRSSRPLSWIKQQEKKLPNFPNVHFQPHAGGLWQTAGQMILGGFAGWRAVCGGVLAIYGGHGFVVVLVWFLAGLLAVSCTKHHHIWECGQFLGCFCK